MVMRSGRAPFSARIVYTCGSPLARVSKAIWRPSGDQAGEPVTGPRKFVRANAPEPSALASQTSEKPPRSDSNAIRLPSGE